MESTGFTESHLRKMIESAKGREIILHLHGGTCAAGTVVSIDRDRDGFIEIDLGRDGRVFAVVTPVENIVAYEVAKS